jgi:hypothetical protein
VIAAADRVVLVARSTVGEMVHLAPWVEQLVSEDCRVEVVLVAARRGRQDVVYEAPEVADALGVAVLGVVADDAGAASRLFTQPGSATGLLRGRLARSVSPIASVVLAVEPSGTGPPVDQASEAAAQEAVIR